MLLRLRLASQTFANLNLIFFIILKDLAAAELLHQIEFTFYRLNLINGGPVGINPYTPRSSCFSAQYAS